LYKQYLIQNIVNFKVSLNREKLKTTFKIASWFLLVITLLIANGCTNQKNTTVTRAYHNITSRYNVMFNGKEALKEGRQNIYEGIEDDFTEILPVFPHSDENAISSSAPDMERAIKKSTKLITLHSITAKPELNREPETQKEKEFLEKNEYNKYVDDTYLIIGKAHFYKHEFQLAIETFKYIIKEFPKEDIRFEAIIWMIRSYAEMREFKEADRFFNVLVTDMEFPGEEYSLLLNTTYADFYIKQNMYEKAIPYLEKALDEERKKQRKIRYNFILAQLHERAGELDEAFEYYTKVIKLNPPYKMAFNALINRASAFKAGSKNAQAMKEDLQKMLKDDKNKEFQDQIYYALGEVEYKLGNVEEAIEYYKLSAQKSISNQKQKATSYVSIADIYYNRADYENAAAYYDSTSAVIDENFPEFNSIQVRANNLGQLVENLHAVKLQDSLQYLASLTEKERLSIIDGVIAKVKEEERLAMEQEREMMMNQQYYQSNNRQQGSDNTDGGKWYFYNPTSKGMGAMEFKRKWGNRELEDNWRRKSKKMAMPSTEMAENLEEDIEGEVKNNQKVLSNKSREYYLQEIPLNDSLMKISHAKIIESLYNAGIIYQNDLEEYQLAIESFEKLIKRYDESVYHSMAYFHLYELYRLEDNDLMASHYRGEIIERYPESVFAKILSNPDFLKELEARENYAKNYYETTYNMYNKGEFNKVIARVNNAYQEFPDHELLPRFEFLEILASGQSIKKEKFRETLNEYVVKYPETEQANMAENIIGYMDEEHPEIKEEVDASIAEEIYTYSPDTVHYFGISLNTRQGDVNQLIFNLINFNLDNFSESSLNVNSEMLNGNTQIIVVKEFENKQSANDYYRQTLKYKELLKDIGTDDYKSFLISPGNLKVLMEEDALKQYIKYFENHYQ